MYAFAALVAATSTTTAHVYLQFLTLTPITNAAELSRDHAEKARATPKVFQPARHLTQTLIVIERRQKCHPGGLGSPPNNSQPPKVWHGLTRHPL